MNSDIFDYRSSEAALEERMRLARLVTEVGIALTASASLQEILSKCAKGMVRHLYAAFARVWTLNESTQTLELQASEGMYTHLDGPHSRVPVGKFKIGLIAQEKKPHLTNSVVGDPRVGDQEWAKREGLVSFAGYPLIIGDRLVGVMAMFARMPLSHATLDAMEGIAHGLAVGIEGKRAHQQLEVSKDELTRILESITDGFASLDREWRYRFVNPEGARILGRDREELLGKSIHQVFPEVTGTPFEKALHAALAQQQPLEVEQYFRPLSAWFSLRIFPAHDGLSVYYQDVTRRKLAEQRLRMQYAVSQAMNAAEDTAATMVKVLAAIGENLGWKVGLVWTPTRDGHALQCLQTWSSPDANAPGFIKQSCSLRMEKGQGLPGGVWASGEACWVADFASTFQLPRAGTASTEGLHAAFAFPIRAHGLVIGVSEFFSEEIREPDEGLLRALTIVGNQTGDYLDRQRAVEELRESEARKSSMLETALDAVITIDEQSGIMEFNPSAESIFGYRRDDVIGQSMPELIIPHRYREAHYNGLRSYFQTGEGPVLGRRVELAALRSDGSEFPVELAITRIPIEGRAIFTAYLRDITERKRSEREREQLLERAEAAQRYYQVLAEAMPQQVWTSTPDGHLDYLNQGVSRYFGSAAEAILGDGWHSVVHPDDLPEAVERWTASVSTSQYYEVEFRLKREDGTYRWHLGRALPVRDASGAVTKWLGTNTDIHDRIEAERELRKAKEAAEGANQAKSDFLASMSHELRTPLNAIIGYSEMLTEEAQQLKLDNFTSDLDKIHGAGRHLLSLINDVLDLSKIEAGKMELFIEEFDVQPVIEGVVNTIQPLALKNGNHLEVDCEPGLGAMSSDLTKLRQSLFNLLSNASKFTDHGRIRLEARRYQREGEDWLEFRVIDTGIGVPTDKIPSLFEAFSQVDKSRTRKYGGTGLGLAITKRFVDMMNGRITVQSEPGRGSAFTIALPANALTTGPNSRDFEEGSGAAPILVVDDDPAAQDLLARYLHKEGFRTVHAVNGQQALKLAREARPAAITLDVMMPGMDGWSVLSALKADPVTSAIPVIMVSIVDDKNLGYSLGASEYLTKPIDRDRLSVVLEKYRCAQGDCPVLVVEDDAMVRQALRAVLLKRGWRVFEASNGAEALELMRKEPPELILLDLVMPEMDGFEFTEELRKHPEWRAIPIVVITAKDVTAEERRRLNGIVARVLRKQSYSYADLLDEISRLVGPSRPLNMPSREEKD